MSKSISEFRLEIIEKLRASREATHAIEEKALSKLSDANQSLVGHYLCCAGSSYVRQAFAMAGRDPGKLEDWLVVIDVLSEATLGRFSRARWDLFRSTQLRGDASAVSEGLTTPSSNIDICRELISRYPQRYGHMTAKSLSRRLSNVQRNRTAPPKRANPISPSSSK